ncbi:MAG TPA: DUF3040 domain-containing protein [Acidimicrobiales bacterium]|jgi:hypothetical protein|nr:DUF3040 domain-containing protein [Acidimicrobiales bacterium]
MSTPDARLNAAERAALADLESAAAAADPTLAAKLKGTGPRTRPTLARARREALRWWAPVLGAGWWGIPLVVAGLLLMALGLSASLVLSLAGMVMAVVGLRILAELAETRFISPVRPAARPPEPE